MYGLVFFLFLCLSGQIFVVFFTPFPKEEISDYLAQGSFIPVPTVGYDNLGRGLAVLIVLPMGPGGFGGLLFAKYSGTRKLDKFLARIQVAYSPTIRAGPEFGCSIDKCLLLVPEWGTYAVRWDWCSHKIDESYLGIGFTLSAG